MSKKIVSVIIDTSIVTVYHDDGSTLRIPQGDPRVSHLVEKVIPRLDAGETGIEADYSEASYYNQFEEKTNGFVRFFRATKKLVRGIFAEPGKEDPSFAEPGAHGKAPATTSAQAINEIMANATPVNSPEFNDQETTDDHTMVAVVDGKVIPGAENLHDQIKGAVLTGNSTGMENFMRRISAVIDKRRHSIDDVLRFLKRGDLPIADDGSVVAYKILRKRNGAYVDCHSGKVIQDIGSFVFMSPSLVDPDRRNECSTGLHVARRGYLGSFPGDVCVLVKVAPEDFIAVPSYDSNKVRVCGYHILFELSAEAFRTLKRDKSMTGCKEAQQMLAGALRGVHPPIKQMVEITQEYGGGLKVTDLKPDSNVSREDIKSLEGARSLDDIQSKIVDPATIAAKQAERVSAPAPKPTAVAKVTATKPTPAPVAKDETKLGRKEQAQAYVEVLRNSQDAGHLFAAAQNLLAHKKKVKVSWGVLGVDQTFVSQATKLVEAGPPKAAPVVSAVMQQAEAAKTKETRDQKITRLVTIFYSDNEKTTDRIAAAEELIAIQKAARKSWAVMGQSGLSNGELEAYIKANKDASTQPAKSKAPAKVKAKPEPKPVVAQQPVAGETRIQKAHRLYDAKDWTALKAHKKAAKVGWDRLGFAPHEIKEILTHV